MSVSETLGRMEVLSGRFGQEGSGAIIGLRQEFAIECGNLLKAYCDDPAVFGNRELFNELQEGLEAVRSRMSNHQLKWQGERIAQDPAAYHKASEAVNAAVMEYIATARTKTGN